MVDVAECHAHHSSTNFESSSTLTILASHYFCQPINNEVLLRRLYLEMNFSSYQISEITEWSRTSISDALRSLGIIKETKLAPILKYGEKAEDFKVIPHLGEQKVIKQILFLRDKGNTFEAIATHLNQNGIPFKGGGSWSKSTIKNIINREQKR